MQIDSHAGSVTIVKMRPRVYQNVPSTGWCSRIRQPHALAASPRTGGQRLRLYGRAVAFRREPYVCIYAACATALLTPTVRQGVNTKAKARVHRFEVRPPCHSHPDLLQPWGGFYAGMQYIPFCRFSAHALPFTNDNLVPAIKGNTTTQGRNLDPPRAVRKPRGSGKSVSNEDNS